MRAVVFRDKTIALEDRPTPSVAAGELLVRVSWSGICATDIELWAGYYGFAGVAGHEFVGVVTEAPDRPEWLGRRVVSGINKGCGECDWCRRGDPRHCRDRKALGIKDWDGAFADFIKIPQDSALMVNDSISDEAAVFAEPLAAALAVAERVHLTPHLRTVVLGDGKLGLLIALVLKAFTPDLLLVGRHESRLELGRRQGLATLLVEPGQDPPGELGRFDLAVDATGRPEGINQALGMVRPRGVVVAKTTSRLPSGIDLARLVVDEISLVGSRCGSLAQALVFLENKWLDVNPLIEAVYPLEQFPEAFERARQPGAGKVLLRH
jgi:threonine dehydrogenase-like Zn-dependent dehydrogenase